MFYRIAVKILVKGKWPNVDGNMAKEVAFAIDMYQLDETKHLLRFQLSTRLCQVLEDNQNIHKKESFCMPVCRLKFANRPLKLKIHLKSLILVQGKTN